MIEFVFLDLDDTILDFHKAEAVAIHRTLEENGIDPSDENKALYSRINKAHWEMLERGEITRDQVNVLRFARLFETLGVGGDPEATAANYRHRLGVGHWFLPGARETLDSLRGKYKLYLASNGNASVQHSRMTSAGLYPYFEEVFISEEIGYNKPSRAYFDACFARIPGFDPAKAIMVGDSLTSDILGGLNAGLKTCWVNPGHAPGRADIRPDYEIETLSQLEGLLEAL